MSDVTQALRDLQAGSRSIEEVEEMFRTRMWPTPLPSAKTGGGVLAATLTDRDPDPKGSFSEVLQAFYNGTITIEQYEVLAHARLAATKNMRDA